MDSFPFVHPETVRFRDLDGIAEAKSVLVGYDYERGESIPNSGPPAKEVER